MNWFDDDDVIRFPVSLAERRKNIEGPGFVPCRVSERWLKFDQTSHYVSYEDEEWLKFDVMTHDKHEEPYKLCELIVSRRDLEQALEWVTVEDG